MNIFKIQLIAMTRLFMLLNLLLLVQLSSAQTYDILIRNGRVIDPKNGIDAKMDIAVSEGKIAKVSPQITGTARQTVDATGMIVTPGLIDIHGHVFMAQEDHYLSDGFSALPQMDSP